MKSITTARRTAVLASCSAGVFLTLLATASPAVADPVDSAAPPAPVPAASAPAAPAPVLSAVSVQAAGTDIAALPPAPADADPALAVPAAGSATTPLPPNGTPHLASPDALPPGSTLDSEGMDSPNVSYLKDLWQAVQNHEISGKEALVMGLAQRGMSTPYPEQAPGPNVPITPGNAPAPDAQAPPAPDAPAPPTP